MGLQCVSQNVWQTVSEVRLKFRSSPRTYQFDYELIKKIADLRTKGSILRESSKFASYEFLKLTSTSKLLLTLNWYFIMAGLSNRMKTFKDKMDDKGYQYIFETHAANQFTSRLQLVLFNTSDQIASLSMNAMGHFQANTHCLPPICFGSHCCERWALIFWQYSKIYSLVPGRSRLGQSWSLPWAVTSPKAKASISYSGHPDVCTATIIIIYDNNNNYNSDWTH